MSKCPSLVGEIIPLFYHFHLPSAWLKLRSNMEIHFFWWSMEVFIAEYSWENDGSIPPDLEPCSWKTTCLFFNRVFATAKLSFPKAKFGQILAREFEQIRISCGFRTYFIGACQHFFFPFFSEQALQSWNGFLLELGMQIHISPYSRSRLSGTEHHFDTVQEDATQPRLCAA